MELLQKLLLVVHLLGFAALFGGAVVQLRDEVKAVNLAMLSGALVQVASGILLVGVLQGRDEPVDNAKIAVKLAIALVIALLCWVNRAKPQIPPGLYYAITILTLANVCIAVLW